MEFDWVKKINADEAHHQEWMRNHDRKIFEQSAQNDKDRNTAWEIIALKNKVKEYEDLLSRPMKEIANANGDFKKTYDIEQGVFADWILSQKAYKETAMLLGINSGKSPEEIVQMADEQRNTVLNNQSELGNNASTSPLLERHAAAILAIRKKNGKA